MKHGRRLKRWMKKLLKDEMIRTGDAELSPGNWLYVKNEPGKLEIQHRDSQKIRIITHGEGGEK